MRGLNNITIRTSTAITMVFTALLILAGAVFLYILVTSFIKPFFLDKFESLTSITLDSSFDEVVQNLSGREALPVGRQDLTVASPSATLIEESTNEITAEIINASGVAFAAKNLGDELEALGVAVSQLGNSQAESEETIISFKDRALFLKDRVSEKVGSRSSNISIVRLDDTYPYDIRVVIGR